MGEGPYSGPYSLEEDRPGTEEWIRVCSGQRKKLCFRQKTELFQRPESSSGRLEC